MAGPAAHWAFPNDPDHEWTIGRSEPLPTATPTATRVLDNYVGGAWTPAAAAERARRHQPGHRRGAGARAALAAPPTSTPPSPPPAPRCRRGARSASSAARGKLFALREGLDARQEDLARSVTTEMGKTIVDARAEVARMIEMVEAACAIPTTMQGRDPRGRLAQRRRRDRAPAGRRVRRDRALQLPGDGAVLVPALRDRAAATRSSSSPPSRCR